jgi:hypothetical protein
LQGEEIYTFLPKNSNLLQALPFEIIYEVYAPSNSEKWLEIAIYYDAKLLSQEETTEIDNKINFSIFGITVVR